MKIHEENALTQNQNATKKYESLIWVNSEVLENWKATYEKRIAQMLKEKEEMIAAHKKQIEIFKYEIQLFKTSVSNQKNIVQLYKSKFHQSELEVEELKNMKVPALHTVVRNSVFNGRDNRLPFLHKE